MKRIKLLAILVCICLGGVIPAGGMGQVEDLDRPIPPEGPAFLVDGDFEDGLTGHRDSGYGVAMPWVPYVSTSPKYSGQAQYEVIYKPLGAIYSGRLAQRWWGDGRWRGGIYQSFSLPPGLYSIEMWYADPPSAGLQSARRTNIRMGVYDGISGYEPPLSVRWSPGTNRVGPQWNRIIMSGVPLMGRAATLYIETWNDAAQPHNVVVDQVEVRALSFFGEPESPAKPGTGKKKGSSGSPGNK